MGRDWYWGGGVNNGRSSKLKKDAKTTASGNGGCRNNSRSGGGILMNNNSTVSGCMGAVFHLFSFHHFQLPLSNHNHHDQLLSSPPPLKPENNGCLSHEITLPNGVEAPRNSLESIEDDASLSPSCKEGLNISMGMRIKTNTTRNTRSKLEDLSNNDSYSPSTKTPNLVARLMGLDLLPDQSPSSLSLSYLSTPTLRRKSHTKHKQFSLHRSSVDGGITGTRSLPETPRISLARRSDADHYQHRLSLQLSRENMSEQEVTVSRFTSSRKKELKQEYFENRSPRDYARQIVKQVKESVSRRVGTDITNTIKNREQLARDHHHSKKTPKILTNNVSLTPSGSPRLEFLENTNPKKPSQFQTNLAQIEAMKVSVKPNLLQTVQEEPRKEQGQEREQEQRKPIKKCKKAERDMKFVSRLVKPPQTMQEEPFVRSPMASRSSNASSCHVDKKCKKMVLSNDLLNLRTIPSLLVKKDPSPPATKLPHKQSNLYKDAKRIAQAPRNIRSQFSSCSRQTHGHDVREQNIRTIYAAATTATSTTTYHAEHEYITRILRRAGIDKDTPICFAKWFSPSHPLDPSIFYFLEHFAITTAKSKSSPGNLGLRCNRKLLFHLVDEILVDVLKPQMNMKPWVCDYPIKRHRDTRGPELIDTLCLKIGRFPRADCRVLEDIDALVDGNFLETKAQRDLEFEEEGEGIVTEIEREILDLLVNETTSDYVLASGN